MKILFIAKGDLPDYQSDMVFHGGRALFGKDFVDANRLWYMYKEDKEKYWNQRAPNGGNSYGRGFTIAGTATDIDPKERENLAEKIEAKYFDYIIYGSVTRCQDFFPLVTKVYSSNQVIFIDGEDGQGYTGGLTEIGHLFKRELVSDETNRLHSINFCIPEDKIVASVPEKTQDWGTIKPGDMSTYIFNDEPSYYKDYQKSHFGLTFVKGGWDCLRHYEILMNGCIPYFVGLENCPTNTMKAFPKQRVLETNKIVESENLDSDVYKNHVEWLLDYTRKNLTTKAIVSNMLSVIS